MRHFILTFTVLVYSFSFLSAQDTTLPSALGSGVHVHVCSTGCAIPWTYNAGVRLSVIGDDPDYRSFQISNTGLNSLAFRTFDESSSAWNSWKEILTNDFSENLILNQGFFLKTNRQSGDGQVNLIGLDNSNTLKIGDDTSWITDLLIENPIRVKNDDLDAISLDIEGAGEGRKLIRFKIDRPWLFTQEGEDANARLVLRPESDDKEFIIGSAGGVVTTRFRTSNTIQNNRVYLVPEGGSVIIGELGGFEVNDSYELIVDGNMVAEEIDVVTNVEDIPDYVFEDSYDLMDLMLLKQYIEDNGHLPEVPSAQDVADNDNKMSLGEMNLILLRKVEELTLYMIELKEENEEIKRQLKESK